MDPNEPQAPLQTGELDTPTISVSVEASCVTEIFNVTGEPCALTVNVAGEMLTTGPDAAVIVKVLESETPEPFPAVTVTVTEFGDGRAGAR